MQGLMPALFTPLPAAGRHKGLHTCYEFQVFIFIISSEEGGKVMQVFFWVAFFVIIIVAMFAVQNSGAPPVSIKFLLWKFETSLVYTILGSIGSGILLTLLFWIPREIRAPFRKSKSPPAVTPSSPPK